MKLCYTVNKGDDSLTAYALLRTAFTDWLGIDMPNIQKTPSGKPYFPDRPDIHFSISHTSSHVMCAISFFPVGVDVEAVRPIPEQLPARVCSPEELEEFDFFELWTLKESFIKLSGHMTAALREICFARDGDIIKTPDKNVFAKLYGGAEGCMAAVCTSGDEFPETMEFIPFDKLLFH